MGLIDPLILLLTFSLGVIAVVFTIRAVFRPLLHSDLEQTLTPSYDLREVFVGILQFSGCLAVAYAGSWPRGFSGAVAATLGFWIVLSWVWGIILVSHRPIRHGVPRLACVGLAVPLAILAGSMLLVVVPVEWVSTNRPQMTWLILPALVGLAAAHGIAHWAVRTSASLVPPPRDPRNP